MQYLITRNPTNTLCAKGYRRKKKEKLRQKTTNFRTNFYKWDGGYKIWSSVVTLFSLSR